MTRHGPECEILQNIEEVPTLRLALTLPWAMCWWVFSVTETSKAFQLTKQRMLPLSHLSLDWISLQKDILMVWKKKVEGGVGGKVLRGTFLERLWPLTAANIKVINQLAWSLNGERSMTGRWEWMGEKEREWAHFAHVARDRWRSL